MLTEYKKHRKGLNIRIVSFSHQEGEEEAKHSPQFSLFGQEESNRGFFCEHCGTYYKDFLERSSLACASCYSAFAPQLEELMEKYHRNTPGRKAFTLDHVAPPLAMRRSQKLCEHVLANKGICESHKQNKNLKKDIIPESIPSAGPKKSKKNIIESVRLRVARNVQGLPYLPYLSEKQKKTLERALLSPKSALTSHLLASHTSPPYPTLDTQDEDHLRISWAFAWQSKEHCIKQIFNCLKQIELLDKLYQWQFHSDYGFLTACPALAGHAVRLSFQLQVPALRKRPAVWKSWCQNLSRAGYEIRRIGKERKPVSKKSFEKDSRIQISNRHWAWGVSSKEETYRFMSLIESLVEAEYNLNSPAFFRLFSSFLKEE